MTKHKVEIWVSYYYGGIHLSFSKTFILPSPRMKKIN